MQVTSRIGVDCYGLTDCGLVRDENADSFLILPIRQKHVDGPVLVAVADGIGRHTHATDASRIVLTELQDFASKHSKRLMAWSSLAEIHELLYRAVLACRDKLEEFEFYNVTAKGMGTTLTAALVDSRRIYGIHVGDSRCYLLRNQKLHQLTVDHNLYELTKRQGVGLATCEHEQLRHVLFNAVSSQLNTQLIEFFTADTEEGDTLLFSTDGLHGYVSDEVIERIVAESLQLEQACETLIDAANAGGGGDNITTIIARCG